MNEDRKPNGVARIIGWVASISGAIITAGVLAMANALYTMNARMAVVESRLAQIEAAVRK